MPAGYSATPLAKKLGLKENYEVLLYNEPKHYFDLFSDFPENLQFTESIQSESIDFMHLFCLSFKELLGAIAKYKKALKKSGLL